MFFSIILPIYNVEKYLRQCVDSILRQSFCDYEIILVDDGSTDSSPALCDELEASYPAIKVLHQKNAGLSAARNSGVNMASGEYIIFIDSDDFLTSEHFLEKMKKMTRTSPDIIQYKYSKYFESDSRLQPCSFSYNRAMGNLSYAGMIQHMVEDDAFYGMAWIKAIRKNLLDSHHIAFEVGLLGEDMEWNYHLVCHAKSMALIDEAFIAYRQREGSITSTHRLKNLTDFIYILEKWSSRITSDISDTRLKTALLGSLAKYYSNLLVVYSRLKNKQKREYRGRIKQLGWLLSHSMSRRPKLLENIYRILGFDLTIMALKALDAIK